MVSTTAPARSSRPSRNRTPGDAPVDTRSSTSPSITVKFAVARITALHGRRIELAIGLGARPAHRRAFAAIEHAELDAPSIGHAAHQPIERIDLAHQMPLAQPADRRIARHGADGGEAVRDQRRSRAHARGGGRSLAAGMAATNHNHIEASIHRKHHLSRAARRHQKRTAYRPD